MSSFTWKVALLASLVACDTRPRDPHTDDRPTFGEVALLADEDLRDLIEDERKMFEAIYEKTRLRIRYLPERELTSAMLHDSVRMVFTGFVPGADQLSYFRTRNLVPHVEAIATDGIAVLVARGSPIDSLPLSDLRMILEGQGTGELSGIKALFNGPGSGAARTLVDSLFAGDPSRLKNAAAVASLEELLKRIGSDPTAIGFLSFALFSDADDPEHRARVSGLKILAISDTAEAVLPDQGTLKDGRYPLRRKINMIVTEGKSGLGTGFASFVAGPKGQRIILKQGLAPVRVPSREISIVQP